MAKAFRYALATFFFVASVGCLALWWRSYATTDMAFGPSLKHQHLILIESFRGSLIVVHLEPFVPAGAQSISSWQLSADQIPADFELFDSRRKPVVNFGRTTADGVYLPLWYAALVCALAGIGILRFRRQFSIRSALILTAVVAALIGIAVTL